MNTPEIIISSITAVAAILALIISIISIRQSNKQAMYERRLDVFLKLRWLHLLVDSNSNLAKTILKDIKNKPLLSIDYFFIMMTNNSYLEDIQPVISHTLESEWQRKYLLKVEDMRSLNEEIRLIFPESICHEMSDFVYYYSEMLVAMYKYKICIDNISETCKKFMKEFPNDDELENRQRKDVEKFISGTFELGENLFWILDKAKSKIRL